MTNLQKAGLYGIAVLTAFALGRYTAPVKTEIKTQTVEVEKKTEQTKIDTNKDLHRTITRVKTTKPDGSKEETTKIVEDSSTKTKATEKASEEDTKSAETSKLTVKEGSRTHLQGLLGGQASFSGVTPLSYGLNVSKTLLGPVSIGLWGLNTGIAGVSIGLNF